MKKADYRTVFSSDAPVDERVSKILDGYFQHFVQPEFYGEDDGKSTRKAKPSHCVNCGAPQTGVGGALRWGPAHGDTICGECGWPGRAIHIVKDPKDGTTLVSVRNFPLQVHPDYVRKAEEGGMKQ